MFYNIGGRSVQTPRDDYWAAANATLIGKVVLERDVSIWFNAVLRGDNESIVVGAGSNVQDGCVLHTDPGFPINIERSVTVGHMVMLHGCTIGAGTLIGIGSIVLNGAKIGENCLLGAGALIPEGKEIPPNSVVMGAPGKVIREVGEKEQRMLDSAAQHYIVKYKLYRDKLRIDDGHTNG